MVRKRPNAHEGHRSHRFVRPKASPRLALSGSQLRAHPWVNTALELGCCSAGQDGADSGWTVLRQARSYEYVGWTLRLRDEVTEGNGGALRRGDRIARLG